MKKIKFFILMFAILVFAACKSDADKDKNMANGMCDCFNLLKDSIPAEGMKVFEKAAVSAKPEQTFKDEMQNLPAEVAAKVNATLMLTGKPGSAINNCLKELDKKYKTAITDKDATAKKLTLAVKDRQGCDMMLALLRMNEKK
jgi:hypothetical protein